MTIVTTILLALLAFTLAGGWYFRVREKDVETAAGIWETMVPRIEAFVRDETVPARVASDVIVFSALAGCGCFVWTMARDLLNRRNRTTVDDTAIEALSQLTVRQRTELALILRDVVLFDSYHGPIMGRLVRAVINSRIVQTAAREGSEAKVGPVVPQTAEMEGIKGVLTTAKRAFDNAKSHSRLPERVPQQLVAC